MAVFAVTVMGSRYWALSSSLEVISRAVRVTKASRLRTPAKLYVHETLLERLPPDLQDVAAELRQFIQEEHTVVRE